MIHANFLLPEPTCQTTLAHPLLGCIPEDLEDSITSTLWKEMGVNFISDKKPRIDCLRWAGHTEKMEEQLL